MKTSSFSKFISFWKSRSKRVARSQSLSYKPTLESLGDRVLPATGSISGIVFQDLTGNGLSSGDVGQSNVMVALFRANNTGHFGFGRPVGFQTTAADGSYSFNNLAAGQYTVAEFTPSGEIETAPTTGFSYAVNLASGQAVTGEDFANFQMINTSGVRNVTFTITSPNGTQTTVRNLHGNTQQGDTVTVNFTIAAHSQPVTLSLVSYNAPGPHANSSTADTLFADSTGTFGPGTYSLTVQLPNNFYQVDFVAGDAISQFGPAGSSISYQAQGRLLSQDNSGTTPVQLVTLSGTVTDTNGNPLTGATVTITNLVNGVQTVATTGAGGTYSVPGLQAGLNYSISVSDSGFVSQSTTLMLTGSEVENFQLVSTSPVGTAIISGQITFSDPILEINPTPSQNDAVTLLDSNGNTVATTNTDSNGDYSFGSLAAGTYTVVETNGGSSMTVTIGNSGTTTVNLAYIGTA